MKIQYVRKRFGDSGLQIVETANAIIAEYQKQGFDLTLRQLYYQFVARDIIANKQSEYKRLGSIINDARLAGLISWEAIVDRTRNLQSLAHWEGPKEIVEICAQSFRIDKWALQPKRVEVWIEKDALAGVIENVCKRNDVPFFSCRGYTSQSEMWSAGRRLLEYIEAGQEPVIIHLGDHDPSGIDMSRDITDRLEMFAEQAVEVNRIALNMDQIHKYNPPPNPAKLTDSRSTSYVKKYGKDSWELDALEPSVLEKLIEETILVNRNADNWAVAVGLENKHKKKLQKVAKEL